jgi:hypothetical protein
MVWWLIVQCHSDPSIRSSTNSYFTIDPALRHITLLQIQQRRVAALSSDVHADRLLGGVADQAVGAAGLGPRT